MADEVYEFDDEAVQHALRAAETHHNERMAQMRTDGVQAMAPSDLRIAAQCVSVTVHSHKVCVKLPLGLGKHCLPIPLNIGDGTAGKACLHICTKFGFPTGVRVTVEIAGVQVVSQSFGAC